MTNAIQSPTAVRSDIEGVLQQMRAMREMSGAELRRDMRVADTAIPEQQSGEFANLLRDAVDSVSQLQSAASAQANAFVKGETNDLVSVMVAGQKSSVAFQALTQVRNRVVSAYQDIMNMPI